jgi:PIN domain nuclease of toxin-antitoxin system
VKILLDTCTFLWMVDQVDQLGSVVRAALEDATNELVFHQASSWEIQIKYDLGKLPLARPPKEIITDGLRAHDIQYQVLQDEDIWHLRKLPPIHGDPFDRMLIAHALCNGLKLASPDPRIARYPVPILWE